MASDWISRATDELPQCLAKISTQSEELVSSVHLKTSMTYLKKDVALHETSEESLKTANGMER